MKRHRRHQWRESDTPLHSVHTQHTRSICWIVAIAFIFGSPIGICFGLLAPRSSEATALISIGAFPVAGLYEPIKDYVAGEVGFLNSPELLDKLRSSIPGYSVVALTASQSESAPTYVELRATADSPDNAVRVLNLTLAAYDRRRETEAAEIKAAAESALERTVAKIANNPDTAKWQRDLESVIADRDLLQSEPTAGWTILTAPRSISPKGPRPALDGLLAGSSAVIVALAGAMLYARLMGRVTRRWLLSGAAGVVAYPEVRLSGRNAVNSLTTGQRGQLGGVLHSQLSVPRNGSVDRVCVIGFGLTSDDALIAGVLNEVGTDETPEAITLGAACANELNQYDSVVLAVRIGRDKEDHVRAVRSALAARGFQTVTVALSRPFASGHRSAQEDQQR